MYLLRSYSFFVTLAFILYFLAPSPSSLVNGQGHRRSYTTQEKASISKLRSLVEDKLTLDYMRRDGYLLRFIRSYEFDISKAHKELEKLLKWRKENNIDKFVDGDRGSERDLAYIIKGVDRGGRPIMILPFGKWFLRKYVLAGKREEALQEFKRMTERTIRKVFEVADKTGHDVDQFYALTDFTAYNRREHMCAACVPLTLQMAASFDSAASVFVRNLTCINMPKIFQPVLTLIRGLFGFLSLKSLTDFDSNKAEWQPAVLNDIAPDQLPQHIGGARYNIHSELNNLNN